MPTRPDSSDTTGPQSKVPLVRRPLWRRWLGEPLLHFLLAGAALFAIWRVLNPAAESDIRTNVIALTQEDLLQIRFAWVAQGRPAPTPEQMRHLIEARVREEILYREALALGLDKGDTIVRRRLAQKMEFLSEDMAAVQEPAPGELRTWFDTNAGRFASEPRVSFRHIYFSPDRRGTAARAEAERVLARLADAPADAATAGLGDPFMFQDSYADRTPEQVLKLFGHGFTRDVFALQPGAWRGPIASGYGWHLVFTDMVIPSRVPAFEEVETEAKAAWIDERRAESRRRIFEAMRARYRIEVAEPPAVAASRPPAPDGADKR